MKPNLSLCLLALIACLIFSSCKPEIDESDFPIQGSDYNSKLSIVWQQTIRPDSAIAFSLPLSIFGDNIVYCSHYDGGYTENSPDGILVFNKLNGTPNNVWRESFGHLIDGTANIKDYVIGGPQNSTIYICDTRGIYAYNLNTAQRLWKNNYANTLIDFHISKYFSNITFQKMNFNSSQRPLWSRLLILNGSNGTEDPILTVYGDSIEDEMVYIQNSVPFIRSNGDTLLLFSTSAWNFTSNYGTVKMYCYNITHRKIEWIKENFTADMDASAYEPIITENNQVIVHCLRSIHCFDILTGDIIWQQENLDDSFGMAYHYYHDGNLYCHSQKGYIYCFNAQTGQIKWVNRTADLDPEDIGYMEIYNNTLFVIGHTMETGELAAISPNTGETLWIDHINNDILIGGVTIDQQTGYLYCTGYWSVICIDLNKTMAMH